MGLEIRLLGEPCAILDGEPLPTAIRRKAWSLLAVVLMAERPPTRRALASLLFADADDPRGALRWTLSHLRRALRGHLLLDGDPLVATIAPSCQVDVLLDGRPVAGPALLEGFDGSCGAEFDLWLIGARRAAYPPSKNPPAPFLGPRDEIAGHVKIGREVMAAGAAESGLTHLREAVRRAAARGDERLEAVALRELGGGLVHAVAVNLAEGHRSLVRAAHLGRRCGDRRTVAEALRDLAYVANAAGHTDRALRLLGEARSAADGDNNALSSVNAIEGMFLGDRGEHRRAMAALRLSISQAEAAGRGRQATWSASMAARTLIQAGKPAEALVYAERAATYVRTRHWLAMQPWTESLLAELELADDDVAAAERRFGHAWSLSGILADRCWQATAARGLGLALNARGRVSEALDWADRSVRLASQHDDHYAWILGWARQGACQVSVGARLPRARADVAGLARTAHATGQPYFLDSARLFQTSLARW